MGPKTAAKSASRLRDEVVLKANAFIKSLETFEVDKNLNSSAKALASSTRALLEAVNTTIEYEYAAPLFTFVKLRPESFPEVRYLFHCGGIAEEAHDTVDFLFQRADGVFFAIKAFRSWGHEIAFSQLAFIKKLNGTSLHYGHFSLPVPHTVIVGVEFLGSDGMCFSYLVDAENSENPLEIKV